MFVLEVAVLEAVLLVVRLALLREILDLAFLAPEAFDGVEMFDGSRAVFSFVGTTK